MDYSRGYYLIIREEEMKDEAWVSCLIDFFWNFLV
jgi:hypothetical protein